MSTQPLERIIYTSMASLAVKPETVQEILLKSRQNNARKQVTGALIYYQSWFLQILEGPRDVLDGLVATIEKDPRHFGMRVVSRDTIDSRGFPDWSMSYIDDRADVPKLIGMSSIGAISAKIYDESAFLRDFIKNCREYVKNPVVA